MILLKGNILHTPAPGQLEALPHGGLLLEEDGTIREVLSHIPEGLEARVIDYGDRLLLQSFCDMHLHAPQYPMLGMGTDLPLLQWLHRYAYPTEARFADTDYARRVYRQLAQALIANGTTRVCMFSSLHTDATLILMAELERAGLVTRNGEGGSRYRAPLLLTPAGREAAQSVNALAAQAVERAGAGLTDWQRENFYQVLGMIAGNLHTISREGLQN